MEQPSNESILNGEELVKRLENIEKLVVNLNKKTDNCNRKCIHDTRLINLENSLMTLKSKIDVLDSYFHRICRLKKNNDYSFLEEEFERKDSDSKDYKKKFVSKQCERTLKSPSKSPFLKVNVEEFNSHPKRKLQFEKDKMTSKSKKMGIPDIFKNISLDEPILPRGLKTLKDSPISVKQEQSTKTKYISPPSTKKLPIIHSKSKRSMVEQDSKNTEKSLSKNDGLSNDEETPTPLYKQYLQYLSVEEAEICNKVYKYKELGKSIYCHDGTNLFWNVGDILCLFPDLQLHDFLIDLVAFDMSKESLKKGTKKLYLPAFFQGLVDGYDVYNDEPYATGVGGLSITLRDYVPKDTGHVEQVYIPILENMGGRFYLSNRHWFLVVIDFIVKKCYLLDSLNTTIERKDMALKLLAKASKCVQHIPPLFQLLKDVTSFEMEVCETLKQMNGHDCGMYVIKYMENDHVSQWKKIRYTTEEMRVERLKCLVKILKSEFNYKNHPWNIVKEILTNNL